MRDATAPLSRPALVALVALVALGLLAGVHVARGELVRASPAVVLPMNPDDPGRSAGPSGWSLLQWNFLGRYGVDAPQAWANLIAAGAAGGRGVTVAVLDTGIAYPRPKGSAQGGSDFRRSRIVPGYDFIDGDSDPSDENGHGTHVASTIAEATNNGYGLTGLAYGVRIMPVRVLDRYGDGDAATIGRGVRFAANHGAKVINLSLSFAARTTASQISALLDAIKYAHKKGVLVVAGAGNLGRAAVSFPARGAHVLAVGATTQHGCLASYSNRGAGVDLVAPGGGSDAAIAGDPLCRAGRPGRAIYQVTMLAPGADRFGVRGFIGTSMAAPHVSATAALVVASGVIGDDPSPATIQARLKKTARDLGRPGVDQIYGSGLVDAATATMRGQPRRPTSGETPTASRSRQGGR
jgi:serine protease